MTAARAPIGVTGGAANPGGGATNQAADVAVVNSVAAASPANATNSSFVVSQTQGPISELGHAPISVTGGAGLTQNLAGY